jgi:cobalamin biosynthesis protein CobT
VAKHTAADDASFRTSLIRHVAAAVALVLGVGAAFWGVGQLRSDDPGTPVVAQPTEDDPDDGGDGEPADPDDAGDGTPTEDPTDGPEETPTDEATEGTEEETATEEPTEDEPEDTSTEAVEPASVSVQVLDAVLDDAGVAAQGVADQMEADGYRIVVVNRASRVYAVTTVFWTPGNEAAARQIAAQYGFDRVELRPDNLSDTVSVHVVVGQDY